MSAREKTRYGQRSIPWNGRWYKLERWRKMSRAQLRKEPLCAMCFAKGKIVAATVADHVVHHQVIGIFFGPVNCKPKDVDFHEGPGGRRTSR